MTNSIRAVVIVASVGLAFAGLPARADGSHPINEPVSTVAKQDSSNKIMALDRKHDTEQPSPGPILPPIVWLPDDGGRGNHGVSLMEAQTGTSVLGSAAFGTSSKADLVERSLRSVAERLR